MRERTYWPKLCLVQVAGPDDAAAIDALAEGIDLAPLVELMANPNVLKVFHAARQDLEIFYLRMTQGAAAALRHPGRRHGLRLRRGGLLRIAGHQAGQGPDRQVEPLHRLEPPAAQRAADHLRAVATSPICAWSTRS